MGIVKKFWLLSCLVGLLLTIPSVPDAFIVDDNIYHLTQDDQEKIINDLVTAFSPLSQASHGLDFHESAWKELDIDLLIAELDRTKTVIGKNRFKELLKPLSDLKELEKRRTTFLQFTENGDLFNHLHDYIDQYQAYEWLLLSLFDDRSSFEKYLSSLVLFNKGYRTNNSFLAGSLTRLTQLIEVPTAFSLLYWYARALKEQVKEARSFAQQAERDGMPLPISCYIEKAFPIAINIAGFLKFVFAIHEVCNRFVVVNAAIRTLHGSLIHLASMVHNLESIEKMIPKECEPFHAVMQRWHRSLKPTSLYYHENFHVLIELLQDINFKKSTPSAQLDISFNILWKTYERVLNSKDCLAMLIEAYGIADAYLSVASLYKEYARKKLSLSWVTFEKGQAPFYRLEGAYNPLVSQENIVMNSFVLGGNSVAKHMMLTGPHGCGKTTSMKSIAYAYILGQSILLVPAERAMLVPLTKIGTYLNITDNLKKGISSFMAEKKRMKELRELALNLKPEDICLMLIDEPYAKTLQVVGEERIYNFVYELYRIPQLMMLVATHFEKPACLETESHGCVENYQPELLEYTPGNFKRTFKILKGKAQWWFEDARRCDDFVDWLGDVKTGS